MRRIELMAVAALALLAVRAAEEPLKPSEADLMAKLLQLGMAQQGGHAHESHVAEPISDVEYKAICRDLDEIAGIEFSRNNTSVRIVGEISDPDGWAAYRRVVGRYSGLIADYVTFRPGTKLIEALRQQIASLGFEIVERASPDRPGTISFEYKSGVLRLEGWFLSDQDVAAVRGVVGMQRWLAAGEQSQGQDGRVPCEMRLEVVDRLVDVGIVFVSVDRTLSEQFGNAVANGRILDFELAANFARKLKDFLPSIGTGDQGQGNGGYVRVSSDSQGVIDAFAQDKKLVMRASGHATLNTRDMSQRARYHKGGQMLLKVEGQLAGGDVKEVEYGLTIDCGGRFIRGDEVALDLKLEQSGKPQRETDSNDYDQKKVDAKAQIACRLGQTVILSGSHEVSDSETGPSGFMFLRKIPFVGWVFAGGASDRSDEHYLILVSPTLLENDCRLETKPSAENEGIDREVKPLLQKDVIDSVGVWRWYEVFYFWKWIP